MKQPTYKLNTGQPIPAIGFGTWQLDAGAEAQDSTAAALAQGYRLIDTARIYGNETSVGKAIVASALPRKDLFITTKLWNSDQGYDQALKAFDASLDKLGLDYLDLYLIHWPTNDRAKRQESWRALQQLHKTGRAKAIGVSNFTISHLEQFLDHFDDVPAVNQVEFHPFIYDEQKDLLEFCQKHKIVFEAYSPLARGRLSDKRLDQIGGNYGKSASQVMLRWAIQKGTIPLPRSANPEHIKQNFVVFDFELSDKDMRAIDGLSTGNRQNWDPTNLP